MTLYLGYMEKTTSEAVYKFNTVDNYCNIYVCGMSSIYHHVALHNVIKYYNKLK